MINRTVRRLKIRIVTSRKGAKTVQTYKDLWNLAAEGCKDHISMVAYDTWIANMSPIGFDGSEFRFCVPNDMYRDVITQNYLEIIRRVFAENIGIEPEIRILTESENAEQNDEIKKVVDIMSTYTFSSFVVGDSNSFAFAASRSVAEKYPAISYNPLVLYGPSGVGKTHLALAIYNYIKDNYPEKNLIYMRTEEFTNEVITGIHEGRMAEVRNRFRSVDVLLLDDIHFIAGKDSVQEEFFNTFNALFQDNKQIIVTCDRHISEIKTLEERIKSRLSAGLMCDMQLPDYETRVGIIRRSASQLGLTLSDDVVYFIADQVKRNVRQLEGVIKKMHAMVEFDKAEITRSLVINVIRDIKVDEQPEPVTFEKIIEEVARTYSTTPEEIMSKKQNASISKCRHIAIYIVRELTHESLEQIGSYFGKDHATVHYSIKKVTDMMRKSPREKETIEDIINNLDSK